MNLTEIIILIVALVILIAIIIKAIKVYNILVVKDTDIQIQQGQINTALQKREDLTMQLSILTKRAYRFEGTTQTSSARLRNNGKVAGLNATAEHYPNLDSIKANFGFFQEQITDVERVLREERKHYNNLVGDYKIYVRSFPTFIFAYPLGYGAERYDMFLTDSKDKPKFWSGNE